MKNADSKTEGDARSSRKGRRGISPFRRGLSPFRRKDSAGNKSFGKRRSSGGSFGGSSHGSSDEFLPSKDTLICHGSARAIVFRDHLRLAAKVIKEEDGVYASDDEEESDDDDSLIANGSEELAQIQRSIRTSIQQSIRASIKLDENSAMSDEINKLAHSMVPELEDVTLRAPFVSEENVEIEGQQVKITPLPQRELGPQQEFEPLMNSEEPTEKWSQAEKEVYDMLKNQQACVKTIKNSEWPSFLKRFQKPMERDRTRVPPEQKDIGPHDESNFPFNSFVTSTTILPEFGKKMRSYGMLHAYPVGVLFALPEGNNKNETEDEATKRTKTWSWPAGYAAKTEFNIDHGRLINGREEALVPLSKMREYNHDYVHKKDHMIGGKLIKGGFNVVPYNEVFLRVGGRSRIVGGKDVASGEERIDSEGSGRSYDTGMGLPTALFIRSTKIADILTLLRSRSRMSHVLGEKHLRGIPLIFISPKFGMRVFTEDLQHQFWKLAANKLNPFQNPLLEPVLKVDEPNKVYLRQKAQEQIMFDDDIRTYLTLEECAQIAGGFGATDEFLASIFENAREQEQQIKSNRNLLTDVMTTGLDAALRSNDYYTARQMLVVYSIVASGNYGKHFPQPMNDNYDADEEEESASLEFSYRVTEKMHSEESKSTEFPSLNTWRLRSATNSEGILYVLGAAKIMKVIKDQSAQLRAKESIEAVKEWVQYGEESVAFRIASWSKQKRIESDTNVALDSNSQFMAFVSDKAITNRKNFAAKLESSLQKCDVHFLQTLLEIVNSMRTPCLRLEILQYILGLDNRYSVEHIKHAMDLAITCMVVGSK